MNLTTDWYDHSQKIILLTFEHGWTWEEWDVTLEKLVSIRASVPYPVGLIIDARRGAELPTIRVTEQLRSSWETLPNDGSPLVVLGIEGILRDLAVMMARITGQAQRLKFAGTLDEALVMVQQWESGLNTDEALT
jgi:hypothetical protein